MFAVPNAVMIQYDAVLKFQEIAASQHANYKKWLRYYLDFCANHTELNDKSEQLRLFLEKLQKKRQTEEQRRQAAHAITLYYDMHERIGDEYSPNAHSPRVSEVGRGCIEKSHCHNGSPTQIAACRVEDTFREPLEQWSSPGQQRRVSRGSSHYCEAGYQEKSDSPEWDELISKLAGEIKVRHYSRKTLKTYALWSRQFQKFLKNKPPQDLSTSDVKDYLTFLAVKCKVAASTQNQAFLIG